MSTKWSLDPEVLSKEVDETFVRTGGPGGQHRNKSETGVRLVHRPSGVVVMATERRSQAQNRSVAMERLIERLAALNFRPKKRRPTRPSRAARQRRMNAKRVRSKVKAGRKKPPEDGG
jgi:ribosome-associated protein